MKCKIILGIIIFLLSVSGLYAGIDNEKDGKVVITSHKKVCLVPDKNVRPQQQMTLPPQHTLLRGSFAYGNDVQHGTLFHFNIDNPLAVTTDGDVPFSAFCGDFMPDDPFHMWIIDNNDDYLKKVNIETLEVVDSVNTPCPLLDGLWSALPIHKGTGQIYGIATNGEISVLYEINPFVRSVNELLVMDINALISATFDMDGMMYMFDIDTDEMYVLNINALIYEPIGPAGFDGNYAQGMGLDPATNEVYLAAYVELVGSQLRHLDKLTGNTTLIEELPGETGAFGFPVLPENDFIISGIDEWCATDASIVFGDNGDFPPIPPDFFYPGSEPFEGAIVFQGEASEGGQLPFADVTVMRLEDVYFSQPYPSTNQVGIEIVSLKLKSKEPIFIPPESFFDVFYEIQLGDEQSGFNNITKDSQFGGTFSKELMFYPQISFVPVDNPGGEIYYDPEYPLMFYSPNTYNWTLSPIPNDFDPMGEDPYILLTEGGGTLELWPFLSREDFSFLVMDETGIPVEWFGTGYNNGQWYEYPNYGWWNVWLYDHPYDNSRSKYVRMELDVMPMNPDLPSDVTIVYNWSTGNWTGWPEVDRPPLPIDVPDPIIEDELIVRSEPIYDFQGIINQRELIVNEFVIEDYNPEWLSIDVMGSNFVMNANVHHVCFKPYIPSGPSVGDLELKIGDWLNAETWHNWIGGMDGASEIQLLADDPNGDISKVDFLFSMDMGQTWQLFYTDTDGSEPALSTYEQSGEGDGWAATFYHEFVPFEDFVLLFKADAVLENGEILSVEKEIEFDPTPPDGAEINLEDWMIIEDDHILLEIAPGECLDLDKVWIVVEPKVDSFFKGIPPISQQPHSTTHCSPTAAAACLKYFESQGDNDICGGLSDHDLVDALAGIMKTNQGKSGTYISDIASGLVTWINNNGNDYTVRKTGYDWETMRDELERCQDVISSIFWPNGGGHSMTFNSIVNEPNPDGTITVDWMDPWTGQIEYGQINPGSGHVSNMGGAGGGGSGEMGTMIIVCPKEDDPGPGGGGQVIPGPFPQPDIIVPIPNPGLWWIRILYYDQSMHVARTDLVLKRVEGEKDWGDAPDGPYPTLAANSGAFHTLDGFTYMGSSVDAEPNGLPSINALGDDLNNTDDEDGVTLLNSLVPGAQTNINVVAANPCMLNAWFDLNNNGSWADASDHVFVNLPLNAGANILTLNVPANIPPGFIYARFRVNQNGGITFKGDGYEGEVEDYKFYVNDTIPDSKSENPQYPDPAGWDVNFTYPATLGDDWICSETGPVEDFHFWVSWRNDLFPDDIESAIQKFDVAIYSDIPANQSQTGYSMPGEMLWMREFFPGEFDWELVFEYPQGWDDPYQGFADPWNHNKCFRIDIDGFDDPFQQQEGTIYWLVISAHVQGGSGGGNSIIVTLDNIDPAMPPYTSWTENGVVMQIQDLSGPAGYAIDPDGINMWSALLHCDLSGLPGTVTSVEVDVIPWCGPGCGADVKLYAAGAVIAQATNTQSGNLETIFVQNPGGFVPDELTIGSYEGKVFEIRFFFDDGEEYQIGWKSSLDHWNDNAVYYMPDMPEQWFELYDPITEGPIDLSFVITGGGGGEDLDWGDAPDGPYPTIFASNGARHVIDNITYLGNSVDAEPNGQPNVAAVGDDNNPAPTDEDGVQFLSSIVPGQSANILVKASVDGFLSAWVDFDKNNGWMGEQIFANQQLLAGANNLSFNVPAAAVIGTTYARFRFTSVAGVNLSYTGQAQDGEVEDYLIEIVNEPDKCKMHFIQWPDLTTNGVDVYCQNNIVVADDFRCEETGRITDIHIWGSWKYDEFPEDYQPAFKLGIWSDNPMGANNHSEPLEPLCDYYFGAGDYTWSVYTQVPDGEWFYRPDTGNGIFPGDWTVYKYDFYIPEDLACVQDSGTIYWLSVHVLNDIPDFEFGWKTSMHHFNDYATWQYDPVAPPWNMVCYPENHPLKDECVDMAFYISGPEDTTACPDVWIKDCDADVGGVPSIPTCGSLCQGPDIWVDNNSDGIMDNPVVGSANRLYIRARNLGPGTASNVTSSLYYRDCSTGLTFPTGATFIGSVTPLTIASGGTASGWVSWTVPSPPTTGGHWCIGGLVSSPCDPYTPDVPSQNDNNTCFVNIWALYNRAGSPVPPKDAEPEPVFVKFDMRNPNPFPGLFFLDAEVELPEGWLLEFFVGENMMVDLPYDVLLLPEQELNIKMQATPPPDAEHGDGGIVIVKQYGDGYPAPEALIGDITYPIRVDLYQPAPIPDLSAEIIEEDVELQWTPITEDVAGNMDHIACYNVYKGNSPDFEPGPDNRVGRVAYDQNEDKPGFQWYDEDVVNNKEIIYYIVRVEDEAGYESDNSNLAMVQLGEDYDFGDVPDDPYPTLLANDGARHLVDNLTYLGALVDAEADGQPNATATGDDISNLADEDGITFGPIMPGSPAQISIDPKINPDPDKVGFLQGWMDFNNDGDWDDAGEQIFKDEVLHFSNSTCLLYLVPGNAQPGAVYARFRFSTVPGLNYFGPAPDGEVEDYLVEVIQDEGYKWMQEPCPELSGLHAHDYITSSGLYDYNTIADDWQCNGGVVTDIHWWGNYEDVGFGINYFHLSIHENDPANCMPAQQEIWGMDVPFDMANEILWSGQIFSYEYVLDVPFEQEEGKTYWLDITAFSIDPNMPAVWRWQESDRSTVPYNILCPAVERKLSNMQWTFVDWTSPAPVRYSQMAFAITSETVEMDFGDAPDDPYPTLLANNGARHIIDGITYLGDLIDAEPDGQPNPPATGDDLANLDDEDGVVFRTPLVAGAAATIKVKASVDGVLNVWLDVNRNGFWGDAADHVFVNYSLNAGWNTLTLNVPANARVGISCMRFRFNQQGGLDYYGPANTGEVEDYRVRVFPEGWSFIITPVTHTILVPLNVLLTHTNLSAQDAIGVWYEDDDGNLVCGGADIWSNINDRIVLAYGNDNTTPEKDGFEDGDMLVWKIHHTASGADEFVSVEYDATMPQSDGKFTSYGLSKLTEMIGLSAVATADPTLVCVGDQVQLDVMVEGGSGNYNYSWTSNPPGFTSNQKNPVDTPTQDISYIVQVNDGLSSVTSSVDVSVQPGPTADAGSDVTICEDDIYPLDGTATNYSSLIWTSGGDGTFSDATIEDPVYLPGPGDIADGSVTLTLTVNPVDPCSTSQASSMTITIVYNATADAGQDDSVCAGDNYQLNGLVTHSNDYLWDTDGDGTFDDKTALDAIYTPGPLDVANGAVQLTLTAESIAPCDTDAASSMLLTILKTQTVALFTGWNGLSSYLSPFNQSNNYDLFSPVLNSLIIVYNMDGTFWPDQGTNSLVWDEESGYVIKLDGDGEMIFCGDEVSSQVVNLEEEWNLVPVLCDFDADITSVFDADVDVKIVMEVAGWRVYWPEYNINTIYNLEDGKSYFAFMNSDDVIDFNNASTKSGATVKPVIVAETPWNKVLQTPGGHMVAFAESACKGFAAGDVIGAFTGSGLCAGFTGFDGISTGIVLKGDDPYTWQTDGFMVDEEVSYRLYRPASGEQFNLQVEYDPELDHSGRYHDFSMSAISAIKMASTGISDPAGSDIRIYPNPSHGIFNVEGISGQTGITVFDAFGNEIFNAVLNEKTRIDLSMQPRGVYLVKIKTLNGTHYQKVVIN